MASSKQFSPKRRLYFEKIAANNDKAKVTRMISDHHLNFSAALLAPNLNSPELDRLVPTSDSIFAEFTCLADMHLTDFITKSFIDSFVRKGTILALSHNTRVDTSDCVALLPNGILFMSLTKDTYEQFGIQGLKSPFAKNNRFDVEINLLASYFQPNKKYYERVKRSFENVNLKLRYMVSTITQEMKGDESCELQKYFESCDITFEKFSHDVKIKDYLNIDIPTVEFHHPFMEPTIDIECTGLLFHEWLGCISCGVDCTSAAPDSFDNTLCCPQPSQAGNVAYYQYTGFLTSRSVEKIVEIARQILTDKPTLPWLSVLVWGFNDAPVSWRNRRHGYYMSGDNHYTLVLFPNDQTWIYTTLGDHDEQP